MNVRLAVLLMMVLFAMLVVTFTVMLMRQIASAASELMLKVWLFAPMGTGLALRKMTCGG